MSIKKSLRIILIIFSMIPVIFISIMAHGLLTKRLIEVNIQNIQRTAETSKNGLEAIIETQRTEVSLLAIQSELINSARRSNSTDKPISSSVNSLLAQRCSNYENCEHISLYNINKEIIASSDASYIGGNTDSDLALSYMNTTKKLAIAVDGIKSLTKNGGIVHTMDIGAPILDSHTGGVLGYVISTISTSYFKEYLSSITIGDTGFGILLDMDGTIIYHPNQELIGQHMNSEKLSSLVSKYDIGSISSSGAFEYAYEDTNQIYGYCILPDTNWVLLVKQDTSEIQAVTAIMLSLLLFICVILIFVTIFFASFLTKKYSTPIIQLRDTMRIASEGNLTVQSTINSKNELGELSKNFNKMLHIIKTNYEDLEAMHEELLLNEEQLRSNYDHIEFLAYHDTLTNLPNKLALLNYVNTVLNIGPLNEKLHAIYFVDLDNFKTVNDTLGHEYGDSLLIKTAQLLSNILGDRGMLARAGGDEFLLIQENITGKEYAVEFASEIIEAFHHPLDLDGEVVYVSMSIGISIYPENGITTNSLIKNADIAMYKSKDTGKNKFTLFNATMEEELNRNTLILEVLRNAIDNNEIYIQYQPLLELETNNVIGFEALMRLHNDRLGKISPCEFIPIAEESGLIVELSSWLLKEACSFNKELIDHGSNPRPVSINISSVQINRPGFVALISAVLEETQLPPQCLELEITESTLVSSLMDATQLLNSLQQLGVKVSLDDFGTGYSSLNYLTKMPIDTLKIDKSFVDNICSNEKDAYIAESIIQLAHQLDIRVVAEGVELENQLALLKSQYCDVIQGYVFSKPLMPDELRKLLQENDSIIQYSLF